MSPSNRNRIFESQLFRISVPDNWRKFGDNTSVTFAPEGAFGNRECESVFTHGSIVGIVDVSANDLQAASDQYISGILQAEIEHQRWEAQWREYKKQEEERRPFGKPGYRRTRHKTKSGLESSER